MRRNLYTLIIQQNFDVWTLWKKIQAKSTALKCVTDDPRASTDLIMWYCEIKSTYYGDCLMCWKWQWILKRHYNILLLRLECIFFMIPSPLLKKLHNFEEFEHLSCAMTQSGHNEEHVQPSCPEAQLRPNDNNNVWGSSDLLPPAGSQRYPPNLAADSSTMCHRHAHTHAHKHTHTHRLTAALNKSIYV